MVTAGYHMGGTSPGQSTCDLYAHVLHWRHAHVGDHATAAEREFLEVLLSIM